MLNTKYDFHLVTKWKTAGDSLLGALKLARPDSRRILIVGAGTVAQTIRMRRLSGRFLPICIVNHHPHKIEGLHFQQLSHLI